MHYMRHSIAKILLTVFIVTFISIFFIQAIPGGYLFLYGSMTIISSLIVATGNKRYKIAGCCCLLISLTLFISDYQAGKEYQISRQKHMELLKPNKRD